MTKVSSMRSSGLCGNGLERLHYGGEQTAYTEEPFRISTVILVTVVLFSRIAVTSTAKNARGRSDRSAFEQRRSVCLDDAIPVVSRQESPGPFK